MIVIFSPYVKNTKIWKTKLKLACIYENDFDLYWNILIDRQRMMLTRNTIQSLTIIMDDSKWFPKDMNTPLCLKTLLIDLVYIKDSQDRLTTSNILEMQQI